MNNKKLQALITDYKHFAFILLAVSTFLYMGVLIPDQGKGANYDVFLMVLTLVLLIASFACFKKALTYKKQLDEIEHK